MTEAGRPERILIQMILNVMVTLCDDKSEPYSLG